MAAPLTSTSRYSRLQPPSHRPPEFRKSQLLRSYVSLLQSTPLMLLFQHNNLKSMEWVSIRRELSKALQKVDDSLVADGRAPGAIGPAIKLQIIRSNILEPALRVAEYYDPSQPPVPELLQTKGAMISEKDDPALTHALSEAAYRAALSQKGKHPLTTLLAGPVVLLTFPTVSPQHVKAALQILAPQAPGFPAPTRRGNPAYWDPLVQDGLKKLMLLGARIDGKVFDMEGTRWVGGIDGGLDGLRSQLVRMLEGFGAGLASTLESASRSLYFTMEGRRNMLEEEGKPKDSEASTTTEQPKKEA
jgi:large subunit ribosomal protein L10